jgi:hypothetical protein
MLGVVLTRALRNVANGITRCGFAFARYSGVDPMSPRAPIATM